MEQSIQVAAPAMAPGCFAAASVFSHDSQVCRQCGVFDQCAGEAVRTLEAIQSTVNVRDLLARHEAARKKVRGPMPGPALLAQAQAMQAERQAPAVSDVARAMLEQEEDEVVAAVPVTQAELPKTPVARTTKVEKVEMPVTDDDAAILAALPKKAAEHAARFIKAGLIDAMRKDLSAGSNPFATAKPEFMRIVCDALISGGTTRSALKQRFIDELGWGDSAASSHVSQAFPLMTRFHIAVENDGRLELTPARA
jgi:hypothetical protein